jgi:hypothetical protein
MVVTWFFEERDLQSANGPQDPSIEPGFAQAGHCNKIF